MVPKQVEVGPITHAVMSENSFRTRSGRPSVSAAQRPDGHAARIDPHQLKAFHASEKAAIVKATATTSLSISCC